jgi:predicted outer membrane repeat protein
VPDACASDCNGNGTIDGLDLANGTSADLDHDLVPDECEVATTWHVDDSAPQGGDGSAGAPFRSLRQGMAASLAGDTVLVHDGVYRGSANRGLDFEGRDRVVASLNGPSNCVIDLEQQDRAFRLMSGETAASVIRGFTILDGLASGTTSAESTYGGAILAWLGTPTISDCEFLFCQAQGYGGALALRYARVERCAFVGNSSALAGGAVHLAGDVQLVASRFQGNSSRNGGALAIGLGGLGDTVVAGCTFLENSASDDGGAIHFGAGTASPRLLVAECLVAGNSAQRGAGIHACSSNWSPGSAPLVDVRGSTLVGNAAVGRGGALFLSCTMQGSFANSIVRGNLSSTGHQAAVVKNPIAGSNLAVAWTDWQGGANGVELLGGATLQWGSGNIDADPLFVSPGGPDGNPLTFGDNDYRLAPLSPCIDAGDDALLAPDLADLDLDGDTLEPTPFDLDLLPRAVDDPAVPDTGPSAPPVVDLGPFERQP